MYFGIGPNDNIMKTSCSKRRDFIKKSSLGVLGISLMPTLYRKVAPSDRLRIAHIGVGGMGNNHIQWFAALPEVEIAALCDVDANHLAGSMKNLEKLQPGKAVDAYEDFRRILDRKDIDAITCATPDHWHAQIASLAFQAGMNVYGEKPLSYDIGEGQMMLRELERNKRVFQLGTQIHATENYHRVAELIKAGVIGKVHTVRLWKNQQPPLLTNSGEQKPPAHFNYDFWLGPAPQTPYIPERTHLSYRYFLDYSGGVYADFWCHIADIAWWAVEPHGLKSVEAHGTVAGGFANTPGQISIDYRFEGLDLFWTTQPPDVPGAAERNIGAYFEGEKGTLICDYESREIKIAGETMTDVTAVPKSIVRSPGHQQDFVNAVKKRSQPESDLAYAREMTLPMHLGLISWRLGRKLQWDSVQERCIDDSEANTMLSRKARRKWRLIS
jgi:predicted dehydrogenase